MRERHTFIHGAEDAPDPTTFVLNEKGLSGRGLKSVREEKFSFSVDDLAPEINEILQQYKSINVRWASPLTYETLEPFASRLSPGLHIAYQPKDEKTWDPAKICWWLRKFGSQIDCDTKEVFIKHQTDLHGGSTLLLYQALEDLHDWVEFSRWNLCEQGDQICHHRHRDLYTASSLDVSYDAEAKTLKFAVVWPLRSHTLIAPVSEKRRVEIGILGEGDPPNMKAHEIGLSGTLTVLKESKEPSPALFSFPARHRLTTGKFSAKFLEPAGLHPTLQVNITSHEAPKAEGGQCTPYIYLTLPKAIFADRYQLADELFLASKNLVASKYTTLPVDLEAPAYTTKVWGSNVLLELAQPKTGDWSAEIPLHLRYQKPSESGEVSIDIPYPVVFWACDSGEGMTKAETSPFDRSGLGYDGLFSTKTSFWHVMPRPQVGPRILNAVTVPALQNNGIPYIGLGTAAVVGLGLLWILIKLAFGGRSSTPEAKAGDKKAETKKDK